MRLFKVYIDERDRLGDLEQPVVELMVLSAECLLAVLDSHFQQVSRQRHLPFTTAPEVDLRWARHACHA